ncbi:MAG TPA: DbpA RNA binding domain-containing protein, partial [Gammaproteobacteria bacterium]
DTLATEELGFFYQIIEQYQQEHNIPALEIAAALAQLLQGDAPLFLQNKPMKPARPFDDAPQRERGRDRGRDRERGQGRDRDRDRKREPRVHSDEPGEGMESYRIEVGNNHNVKPGNIVGAIANEAGLDSQNIGRIKISDDYSIVDLPSGLSKEAFNTLRKVWVAGQQLNITRLSDETPSRPARPTLKANKSRDKSKPDRRTAGKPKPAKKRAKKTIKS